MTERRRYRKRDEARVAAVQLDLDTDGFTYEKWGATQTCKPRDWLVDNAGDVYHVDREVFERTYERQPSGLYKKTAPVWAEQADRAGWVETLDGRTWCEAGDYVVSNDPEGRDRWAVKAEKFEETYEPLP